MSGLEMSGYYVANRVGFEPADNQKRVAVSNACESELEGDSNRWHVLQTTSPGGGSNKDKTPGQGRIGA